MWVNPNRLGGGPLFEKAGGFEVIKKLAAYGIEPPKDISQEDKAKG
jgi:hypothetical protein